MFYIYFIKYTPKCYTYKKNLIQNIYIKIENVFYIELYDNEM